MERVRSIETLAHEILCSVPGITGMTAEGVRDAIEREYGLRPTVETVARKLRLLQRQEHAEHRHIKGRFYLWFRHEKVPVYFEDNGQASFVMPEARG